MEATSKTVTHSWVWLLAVLLYFFNAVSIGGATLPLLLTPVWCYLLYHWQIDIRAWLTATLLFLVGYIVVHVSKGVVLSYYLVSTLVIIATILFAFWAYHAFSRYNEVLDTIFRHLLILNGALTIIAIVLLFIPSWKDTVWYTISISQNVEPLPRLKLFTSEASHYSFLLAPLSIYFIARMMFFKVSRPLLTAVLIFVPLILSFSLGVLLCLVITWFVMMSVYFSEVFYNKGRKLTVLYLLLACLIIGVLLYILYPDNPLYRRIANILQNNDTSARGRTYESFVLAHKIASLKSLLFGAGPGQMKVLGRNVIIQYYQYTNMPAVVRIPNACADTIVCFGYVGLAIRLGLQAVLFFTTKVFSNPFRVWLFLFLFIYQFTGSYVTNAAEYLLWALVFAPVFPDFISRKSQAMQGL